MKDAASRATLLMALSLLLDNVCGNDDELRKGSGGGGRFEPEFIPSEVGCSMAHCDPQMTDIGDMPVPEENVGILWRDQTVVGSPYMLGCSSNSKTAVCSFGPVGLPPYLRAYNGDGDILWSYYGLGPLASISAPMIDDLGRVIAADAQKIVMLDNDGSELWVVDLPVDSGVPISPVITQSGLAVVTTTGGYIVSVDVLTGKKIGQADFFDVVGLVPGYFATRNTPAVSKSRENRLYSVNEFWALGVAGADRTNTGRFFAIDVKRPEEDGGEAFDIVWTLDFGSRSGASPTIFNDIIFFDGDLPEPEKTRENDPHFFGVQDNGDSGEFVFKTPIANMVAASPAVDPQGRGVWFDGRGEPVQLLTTSGEIIAEIDVSKFPEIDASAKSGAITFGKSQNGNDVAMFTAAQSPFGRAMYYYVGVDISTPEPELVFAVEMGVGLLNWSTAQGATVLDSRQEPVVILPTGGTGVFAIGPR